MDNPKKIVSNTKSNSTWVYVIGAILILAAIAIPVIIALTHTHTSKPGPPVPPGPGSILQYGDLIRLNSLQAMGNTKINNGYLDIDDSNSTNSFPTFTTIDPNGSAAFWKILATTTTGPTSTGPVKVGDIIYLQNGKKSTQWLSCAIDKGVTSSCGYEVITQTSKDAEDYSKWIIGKANSKAGESININDDIIIYNNEASADQDLSNYKKHIYTWGLQTCNHYGTSTKEYRIYVGNASNNSKTPNPFEWQVTRYVPSPGPGPTPSPTSAPSPAPHCYGDHPNKLDDTCWLGYEAAKERLLKKDPFYLRSKFSGGDWLYWRYALGEQYPIPGANCKTLGTYLGNDTSQNTFSYHSCSGTDPSSLESGVIYAGDGGCCSNTGMPATPNAPAVPQNQCLIKCGVGTCNNENPNSTRCNKFSGGDWQNLAIVSYPPKQYGGQVEADGLSILGTYYCQNNSLTDKNCNFLWQGPLSTAGYNKIDPNASPPPKFQVAFVKPPSKESYRSEYDSNEFTGRF